MADYLIGVDEAGRGPLAGPVAVGSLCCNVENLGRNIKMIFGEKRVRDSKKLSAKERTEIFAKIQELKKVGHLDFAVTLVGEGVIDRQGIGAAIEHGIKESLARVSPEAKGGRVLLDGNLKAPAEYRNQQTIIRGDESEPVIALASICAKVIRDRWLVLLAQKYPNYGLERHKGYGTKAHYLALAQFGLSPVHRRSFCRKLLAK